MAEFTPSRRSLLSGAAAAAAGLALRPAPALAAGTARPGAPIRLFANENRYGPCDGARRVLREAAVERYSQYAGRVGSDALVRVLAAHERVSPEHIVLTAGSTEVLTTAALVFGLGGGEVVCADTTFPVLPLYAERVGGRVVRVPLDAGFAHDLPAMEARVGSGTRLVYVVNPNSPTGTLVDGAQLRAFCEAVSPRATVLVDEAYLEYVGPAPGLSMVDLVRAGRNVIVLRTFSKVYGLAGLRVGYAVARPEVAERLRGLRMSMPNPVALAAAQASLEDAAYLPLMRRRNAEARAVTGQALAAAGLRFVGEAGNYLYVQLGAAWRDLPARLAVHGVHIAWDPSVPHAEEWLRLSMGTVGEMRVFGSALAAVVRRPSP